MGVLETEGRNPGNAAATEKGTLRRRKKEGETYSCRNRKKDIGRERSPENPSGQGRTTGFSLPCV